MSLFEKRGRRPVRCDRFCTRPSRKLRNRIYRRTERRRVQILKAKKGATKEMRKFQVFINEYQHRPESGTKKYIRDSGEASAKMLQWLYHNCPKEGYVRLADGRGRKSRRRRGRRNKMHGPKPQICPHNPLCESQPYSFQFFISLRSFQESQQARFQRGQAKGQKKNLVK